jgi:hypothetical protein
MEPKIGSEFIDPLLAQFIKIGSAVKQSLLWQAPTTKAVMFRQRVTFPVMSPTVKAERKMEAFSYLQSLSQITIESSSRGLPKKKLPSPKDPD